MDMTHQSNKDVVVHMDVCKLKGKPDTNLPSFSKAKLEKLIEEAVVDAYGEEEQVGGFRTMMEEHLALPFSANILGVDVVVEKVDMTRDGQMVRFAAATKSGRESESSICRCPRQRPPVRNGSPRTATGVEGSE
jgi:Calcium binding